MKTRFNLNVVLGLTLVTFVIIGVLVWPAPKEARADTQLIAYVYDPLMNPQYLDDEQILVFVRFLDAEGDPINGNLGNWTAMEWSLAAFWHWDGIIPAEAAKWDIHIPFGADPADFPPVSVQDSYEEFLVTVW